MTQEQLSMFTKVARFSIQQNEALKLDILEMKKYFVLSKLNQNNIQGFNYGAHINQIDFDQIEITFGIGFEDFRVHKKGQHQTEPGITSFEQLPKL